MSTPYRDPETQGLLNQTGFAPNTGDVANWDKTSKDMTRLMWFVTAFLVGITSIWGFIATLLDFQLVNALEFIYILLFSFIILLQNPQGCSQFKIISDLKRMIEKYFAAITTFIFKGLYFMFIGACLVSAYSANVQGAMLYVGLVCGLLCFVVGALIACSGIQQTRVLNSVRQELASQRQKAKFPSKDERPQGMTLHDFQKLCREAKSIEFTQPNLHAAFFAVSTHETKSFISEDAFKAWLDGPAVLL